MAGRYTGPSFKHFEGPGDRTRSLQARARVVAGRLLNRMQRAKLGVLSASEWQPDGALITVYAIRHAVLPPLVRIRISAPGVSFAESPIPTVASSFAYLVWLPEGFVLTPREQTGATQGWGMPRIQCQWDAEDPAQRFVPVDPDGRGTPYSDTPWQYPRGSGAIKQVVLNHFAGNKRPRPTLAALLNHLLADPSVELSTELAAGLSEGVEVEHWPLFFASDDPLFCVGERANTEVFVSWQFEQQPLADPEGPCATVVPMAEVSASTAAACADHLRFSPLAEEPSTAEWQCHWPVEVPFSDEAALEVFRQTNALRESLGYEPLYFPLETHRTIAADLVVRQMAKHGIQAHNHEGFDRIYNSTASRVFRDTHVDVRYGENLATVTADEVADGELPADVRLGQAVYEKWLNSPAHYANLVDDWTVAAYDQDAEDGGNPTAFAGMLQVDRGGSTTINEVGASSDAWGTDQVLDPPVNGVPFAQVFYSNRTWVGHGDVYWEGQGERVSWPSTRPFRYALIRTKVQQQGYALDGLSDIATAPEIAFMLKPWFFYKGRQIAFHERYRVLGAALVKANPDYDPAVDPPNQRSLFKACLYDMETHSVLHAQILSDVPYTIEASAEEGDRAEFETVGTLALDPDDYAVMHAHFSQDGTKCVVGIVSGSAEFNEYYLTETGDSDSSPTETGCTDALTLGGSLLPTSRDIYRVGENSHGDPTLDIEYAGNTLGDRTACYGTYLPQSSYKIQFKLDNGIGLESWEEESWATYTAFGVHPWRDVAITDTPQPIVAKSTWSKIRHVEFDPTPTEVSSYEPRFVREAVHHQHTTEYRTEDGWLNESTQYDCRKDYCWVYQGSGNIYGDYVDNTLTFAQIELDVQWGGIFSDPHFKKTLKLGAHSWVLADMAIDTNRQAGEAKQNAASNYGALWWEIAQFAPGTLALYELLHFDVRAPEDICYTGVDAGGVIATDFKHIRGMTRKLYVRDTLEWESAPEVRTPNASEVFCASHAKLPNWDWSIGPFCSMEFPKAYASAYDYIHSRFLGLCPHESAVIAHRASVDYRGAEYYNPIRPVGASFYVDYNMLKNSYVFTGGFPSRLWPRDKAGFTASDELVFEHIRDVVSNGVIGSFPSFMPWVQKDSTYYKAFQGVMHKTKAWFLRYGDDYIFQLYQPYWLYVPPDTGSQFRESWSWLGEGDPVVPGAAGGDDQAYHDQYLLQAEDIRIRPEYVVSWPEYRSNMDYSIGEAYSDVHNVDWSGVLYSGVYALSPTSDNSDSCWKLFSSLDLQTITGVADLSPNLYPLGVI